MLSKEKILQKILRRLAEGILKKQQPRIVAITGSVGKTTTKEMVARVLAKDFKVGKSEKNYNNEIGIPLAIIGVSGEKKNWWQWLGVLGRAFRWLLFSKGYPEILVLELAADKPGDIKYFCEFIPVEVGILTTVGISHLEKFKNKEAIFQEKSYLLKQTKGLAIYNGDNISSSKLENIVTAKKVSFGLEGKDLSAIITKIGYNYKKGNVLAGMIFKFDYKGKLLPGKVKNLSGRPYLYGIAPALVVAEYFGVNLVEALKSLEDFPAIPGHMSLLPGIKNTVIMDDTYNSAPASVREALRVIKEVRAGRKIVVLGDMLELGLEEEKAHRKVGAEVAEMKEVVLVAVGERMKGAVQMFKNIRQKEGRENLKEEVYWLENSREAGRLVQKVMKEGDLILVKGSQGMRMERVVEEIMAEPKRKEELLVRQNKDWR
jgi:UDP-N-acetylmuramoyl-tripeptide--D-alanyl-D-alanine ligase